MKNFKLNFFFALFLITVFDLHSCQNASENKSVARDSIKIAINNAGNKNSGVTDSTLFPKPTSLVSDFEHILDDQSINTIVDMINKFRDKTAFQIAVVTTSTFAPYDSITSYSVALGNAWGVGLKEVNNGILLVVSVNQRQVRISTGLGMDAVLPDEKCHQIVYEKILPSFRQEKYAEGIINGLNEIIKTLDYNIKLN